MNRVYAKCLVLCFAMAVSLHGVSLPASDRLPVGTHPVALQSPHFPSRLHAFIWRNWQLVPPQRMAELVGTETANIKQIAGSMGLPKVDTVSSEMRERGYITLIRRNWHLLPYEQLLQLLDMTPDELALTLREDDFLYIKLGNLKPKCDPLRYQEPDETAVQRAAEIKQVVREHFGDLELVESEPRFRFVETLSSTEGTTALPDRDTVNREQPLRMVYSYFGLFGDPLIDPEIEPIPDGLLARLAEKGVNGIWMHVVLRQLAPGGEDFPEFGADHERRIQTLKNLVAQAKRYGIGIYLYINEPRAMPPAFFKTRPELAGIHKRDFVTMCTSTPQVRHWISNSLAYVFGEVPDLGGVFTITASENLTNCASKGQHQLCPHCKTRTDAEIIAEVNATIAEGVHRTNPDARVIAWDWGWKRHGDAPDIISLLPKDVALMSVSEWSLPIERGGVSSKIGEYSMSAVGPGPRATKHWMHAKQAGLKTVAKVAVNNTWELSAVPFLPVMDLVAEHCENLNDVGVDGTMLSWTLGGYPSPNLLVSQYFSTDPGATKETVLNRIAQDRYGDDAAPLVRKAWTAFSDAFRNFPYSGAVMYNAPQQMGPANLLYANPTGYRATMVCFPYDDLLRWRGPYSADVFAEQFEKVTVGWAEGIRHLEQAVEATAGVQRQAAESDLSVARAAHLHFASVVNQAKFVVARDAASQSDGDPKQKLVEQILQITENEVSVARDMFDVVSQDSRIGYEASNHYYYVPLDLVEKVINCEYVSSQFATQP
ncbi:hypothetical protein K227x_55640 [Rubripirellula lacrimiformis]|uniref:Beta-hexosaminidase bacterial type N-terminal domain-containing protein n=1 Tax=Rubripirellula lacrimiformis TaxID=1930273 RepID=A0A517NJ21_9BACT|nr:hypothetical protein [Rubripirellula lacrimiformis]QDT07139.1 hypothetical protein K227x_55640 [Rubripirellula lacrimiformis]